VTLLGTQEIRVIDSTIEASFLERALMEAKAHLRDCDFESLTRDFVQISRGALVVLVATAAHLRSGLVAERVTLLRGALPAGLVLTGELTYDELATLRTIGGATLLRQDVRPLELLSAIEQTFRLLHATERTEDRGKRLSRFELEFDELIDVARALTKERDTSRLLGLILERSRFVTSADAGSLYVVERKVTSADPSDDERVLHFKLSQNDSIPFDSQQFQIPVSRASMAGWVVLERQPIRIEDVYELSRTTPYAFDRSFDQKTGYRTKSMLCAPLVSSRGEVIGVLQLINRKRDATRKLVSDAEVASQVVPFDDRSERLLVTLAAQAGIALENALLNDEIRGLFEGFVRASVDAIEARDPTTSGHSRRVAEVTVRLCEAVDRCGEGPYRATRFSKEELKELEYASLLHDFGKIGVRENVLVKAKKLYPHELEALRLRIELQLRQLEVERYREQLELLERGASEAERRFRIDAIDAQRAELALAYETVCTAAEPSVLKSRDRELLSKLERMTLTRVDGSTEPLLSDAELDCLRIDRGSLTAAELSEIRSHVTHTQRFLSRIPWGTSLRNVPRIAGSHHERLDGTGYPRGLTATDIPIQSKMMSIADIFDALTASDRPYKRAVPLPRALDILEMEVKDGHLDGELFRIFREGRVWIT
jgi:HD-GYP domain-containing protein (c-di-GMP phosphodiesterase class II)